jgi:hypothetical protein
MLYQRLLTYKLTLLFGDNMQKYTLIAAALFAAGCVDIKEDTGTETTDTSAEEVVVDPTVSVSWGDSSVSLSITDAAEGASYYWGITENNDCDDCWTAEDCFMGYDLNDGTNLTYCHPASATGAELAYGAGAMDIVEGSTTLFFEAAFSAKVTYIVDDRSSADAPCWTWGADTGYYSGYEKACTSM